jgi:hypothetical protein
MGRGVDHPSRSRFSQDLLKRDAPILQRPDRNYLSLIVSSPPGRNRQFLLTKASQNRGISAEMAAGPLCGGRRGKCRQGRGGESAATHGVLPKTWFSWLIASTIHSDEPGDKAARSAAG